MGTKGSQYITKIIVEVENSSPLHVGGNDEGILIDKDSSLPVISATGIAGAFRSYLSKSGYNEIIINRCFGSSNEDRSKGSSSIFIYDAIGDKTNIEMRPGLKIDGNTGTSIKKCKFEREYLGSGQRFKIKVEVFSKDCNEKEEFKSVIYECFKALGNKQIQFGAYKTTGAGEFDLIKAEEYEYNMHDYKEMFRYLERNEQSKDITKMLKEKSNFDNFIKFELKGKTDGVLLTKGNNSNDDEKADSISIMNSSGEYIIPGPGIKGALKSQCKKIATYLNKDENLIELAFGNDKSDVEGRKSGQVYTSDTVISNARDKNNYPRIKIDKFTSGTITGAKFTDKPVQGDVVIKVKYNLKETSKESNAIAGLITLALRDIGLGGVSLGSGNNIGRGRLICDVMNVSYKDKRSQIQFKNKSVINEEYINLLVKSIINY